MNILEKLQAIQAQLNVPKNRNNDFGNFKYRSCEDIQEAVKPLLQSTKTVLTVGDEICMIGNRFYIKATAILWDLESEQKMSNVAYAREEETKPKMDAAQVTGSASSYARKYALNGLFCIDDVQDPDAQGQGKSPDADTLQTKAVGTLTQRSGTMKGQQGQGQQGQKGNANQINGRGGNHPSKRVDDNNHSHSSIPEASSLNQGTVAWIEKMIRYYASFGLQKQKVLARYGVTDLAQMNPDQVKDFQQLLKKYQEKEERATYEQSRFIG